MDFTKLIQDDLTATWVKDIIQKLSPYPYLADLLVILSAFAGGAILALVLFFLLAWISIPLCAKGKGRLTAILFLTIFAFNMFTDCMYAKFCGIGLWAVGLLFILLQSDTERDEQSSRNTQTH